MSLVLWLSPPPNDISCSCSGSQVDPPPTGVTGERGISSPIGSFVLPCSLPNGSISTSAIFHSILLKMTSYNTYPNLSSDPPENPQVTYHLNVIQAKRRGLINKEKVFKKKYKKYSKILNRLVWLNSCSSSLSIATGISSVATFVTFIGLPLNISLGAASLTGVIASGIISTLTKRYQKKLKKVTKLIDIVTLALVVFERVVSGALKNGIIDEEEFNMLQTLHLETLNELTGIDHTIEVEHRSLVEKNLLEEINNIKKNKGTKV